VNTLLAIQTELKIPKDKFNKFGSFFFRTAEDILEAVKPILVKYGALLLLTDDVIACGNMVFVKSTATLTLADGTKYETTGFARIDENRKGMDAAQVTGSAASYARKYALGALFLIDNEKDPDAEEPQQPQQAAKPAAAPPPAVPFPPPGTIVYPAGTPFPPPPPAPATGAR
jgi:hypothetical protein